MKLDRKQPYGTIHGDDVLGRRYEQNGHFFNAKGEEWVPPPVKAEVKYTQADIDAAIAAALAARK